MKWFRLLFDRATNHIAPASVLDRLVAEMTGRKHPLINVVEKYGPVNAVQVGPNPKLITEWGIDIGGSCHTGRPIEVFLIEGLALSMPSEDTALILADLRACPRRTFDDGTAYLKLHAAHCAMVMRADDRDALVDQIVARLPAADERSEAFKARVAANLAARAVEIDQGVSAEKKGVP
jgi:hypothetical protein